MTKGEQSEKVRNEIPLIIPVNRLFICFTLIDAWTLGMTDLCVRDRRQEEKVKHVEVWKMSLLRE